MAGTSTIYNLPSIGLREDLPSGGDAEGTGSDALTRRGPSASIQSKLVSYFGSSQGSDVSYKNRNYEDTALSRSACYVPCNP